jgi:NADPH2:quinone reductase
MVYGTSLHALLQRANISEKDEVLVLGAAGGVGLAAVDLAKAYGARVVAAVSTKEKAEVCVGYGADDIVVYGEKSLDKDAQKSFTKELKSKSVRGGYSIIYDPVGDCFAEPALRSIGWGGTYLVVGFAAGKIPSFPINLMLLKGCAVSGVFIGRFQKEEPAVQAKNLKKIGSLLAEGKINPFISKTVPMKDAAASIQDIAERKVLNRRRRIFHWNRFRYKWVNFPLSQQRPNFFQVFCLNSGLFFLKTTNKNTRNSTSL